MKIIFFGTPSFAAEALNFLIDSGIEVAGVVTKTDRPRGRSGRPMPSAVKAFVQQRHPHIPIYQPERASDPAFKETLEQVGADLFVVVAYGEIIKQHLLDMPPLGCINLHTSLLPKYRGAAPIHAALLNGDAVTGVSIIEMVQKMDAGPILAQKKVPITEAMNFSSLEEALCKVGGEALLEVIRKLQKGEIEKSEQNPNDATYVSKIDSELAAIHWNEDATKITNCIRAFSPKPGAWCSVKVGDQVRRLKIFKAVAVEGCGQPGEILAYSKDNWTIACGKGALKIYEVQLEGKKRLSVSDFIRGTPMPTPVFP